MDDKIKQALANSQVIDITTTGRKSSQPHRIEIRFHYLGEDEIYITGSPGKRDWYANLLANPDFTFHLKGSVQADLSATATPITDDMWHRDIMTRLLQKMERRPDYPNKWLADSPLVRVGFAAD